MVSHSLGWTSDYHIATLSYAYAASIDSKNEGRSLGKGQSGRAWTEGRPASENESNKSKIKKGYLGRRVSMCGHPWSCSSRSSVDYSAIRHGEEN